MTKYTLLMVAFSFFGASFALKTPMSLINLTQAEYFVNSRNLKDRLIPLSQAIEQSQNIFKPKTEIHPSGSAVLSSQGLLSLFESGNNSATKQNPQSDIKNSDEEIIDFNLGDIPPEEKEAREKIEGSLQDGDGDDAITQMEKYWEGQAENYFQKVFSETQLSAEQSRKILAKIAKAAGRKPGLIYVFAQPEKLEIVLLTPEGQPIHKSIDVSRRDFLKQMQLFLSEVTNPRRTLTTSYLPYAQQLYKWMIAPIEADIKAQNINTLLFALDAGLRSIPIAALHDGNQFLVEKYTVSMTLNLNLIDTNFTSIKNGRVLGMGASKFKEQNPLPAVPVELSTILGAEGNEAGSGTTNNRVSGLWPGKKLIDENFTAANLTQQLRLKKFQIVHLATHGEFKPGPPGNSYIQFSDAKLSLDRLGDLKLSDAGVDLMVLSACKTAVGDPKAQMGFAGMAAQSGVKTVVASLWYVNDRGTLALMTEFYKQLKTASIKAEALQMAQIAMLRNQVKIEGERLVGTSGENVVLPPELAKGGTVNLSHPYYWASFTMIGSPW